MATTIAQANRKISAELFHGVFGPYVLGPSLGRAAHRGIADLMKNGLQSIESLAEKTGCDPDFLRGELRFMAVHGWFEENEHGMFQNSPKSEYLRSDHPNTILYAVKLTMGPHVAQCLAVAPGSEKERKMHNLATAGVPMSEEAWEIFRKGVANLTEIDDLDRTVLEAIKTYISKNGTVVDLGGGNGEFPIAISTQHPDAHIILVDQPETEPFLIPGRYDFYPANFFVDELPKADLYYSRWTIHDFPDEKGVELLQNLLRVISPKAKLLIIDGVVEPGNGQPILKSYDMLMRAVTPGGLERTKEQWESVLKAGGFELVEITQIDNCPLSIIVAKMLDAAHS